MNFYQNIQRVLLIEAHPDDWMLGCGATIARIKRENPKVIIHSIYLCPCLEDSRNKGLLEEHIQASQIMGIDYIYRNNFPRNHIDLNDNKQAIRDIFFNIQEKFNPNIVFTHSEHDNHQDHKAIAECSQTIFRYFSTIFSYESPSSDFLPRVVVQVSEDDVNKKIKALMTFKTQASARPYFFSELAFKSKLINNGVRIREQYAELFDINGKIHI